MQKYDCHFGRRQFGSRWSSRLTILPAAFLGQVGHHDRVAKLLEGGQLVGWLPQCWIGSSGVGTPAAATKRGPILPTQDRERQ
jgi:hypothetical protein